MEKLFSSCLGKKACDKRYECDLTKPKVPIDNINQSNQLNNPNKNFNTRFRGTSVNYEVYNEFKNSCYIKNRELRNESSNIKKSINYLNNIKKNNYINNVNKNNFEKKNDNNLFLIEKYKYGNNIYNGNSKTTIIKPGNYLGNTVSQNLFNKKDNIYLVAELINYIYNIETHINEKDEKLKYLLSVSWLNIWKDHIKYDLICDKSQTNKISKKLKLFFKNIPQIPPISNIDIYRNSYDSNIFLNKNTFIKIDVNFWKMFVDLYGPVDEIIKFDELISIIINNKYELFYRTKNINKLGNYLQKDLLNFFEERNKNEKVKEFFKKLNIYELNERDIYINVINSNFFSIYKSS